VAATLSLNAPEAGILAGAGMKALWKGFSTFAVIGLVNTFLHWPVFFVLINACGFLFSRFVVFREREV
jgi:putative flippase GtrA